MIIAGIGPVWSSTSWFPVIVTPGRIQDATQIVHALTTTREVKFIALIFPDRSAFSLSRGWARGLCRRPGECRGAPGAAGGEFDSNRAGKPSSLKAGPIGPNNAVHLPSDLIQVTTAARSPALSGGETGLV